MAIAGKVGAVYAQTEDAAITFTDEATTANGDYTRYAIADADKRFWDKATAVVVKVDGTTETSGYTIEHAGGVVVFAVARDGDDVVTVSGKHWTMEQVGGFYNWSLELSVDMQEAPEFGDTWKKHVPTQNGFSGSAERYWGNERFFDALGTEVAIALYVDASDTLARYEAYAYISGDGIEDAADNIVNESIDFQGNGAVYYRP